MLEAEKVCKCPSHDQPDLSNLYKLGWATEYADNYQWGAFLKHQKIKKSLQSCPEMDPLDQLPTKLYDGKTSVDKNCNADLTSNFFYASNKAQYDMTSNTEPTIEVKATSEQPTFISENHKSLYRENRLQKDECGNYIDPFKDLITLNYGRRLMYDTSHPDMIYGSQFSSELADMPNAYSFSSQNELNPEIPWCKDLTWKAESETGCWPTKLWKTWTGAASGPPYDGHDDQCCYSKLKVPAP